MVDSYSLAIDHEVRLNCQADKIHYCLHSVGDVITLIGKKYAVSLTLWLCDKLGSVEVNLEPLLSVSNWIQWPENPC